MKIGEYIARTDLPTYQRLKRKYNLNSNKCNKTRKRKKKQTIELGDSVHNLMKHDAHKRIRGRLRQIKWG